MDAWTPDQRNEFLDFAKNAQNHRGHRGPYSYAIFPKAFGTEQEDTKKTMLSQCLANTVFANNPAYRVISLKIYEVLIQKIVNHHYLYQFFWNDIVVMLKGGNAYAYLLEENFPEDFPFSDLDIVIFINPYLPEEIFKNVKQALDTVVLQTISQYKRTLDHMFFLNKPINDAFLSEEVIQKFKNDFNKAVEELRHEDGVFISPFENDERRNACSRNSFALVNSIAHEDSVARVEVPHFDKCERIPLRKSPLFASYNTTISFKRDHGELAGEFDLYRLRLNCLFVSSDADDEIKEERVAADFIDISIPAQNDAELLDFWNCGRSINILEKNAGIWIVVPDIDTCMTDLDKMLHVYDCPEHKRPKREAKYNKFKEIARNLYTKI